MLTKVTLLHIFLLETSLSINSILTASSHHKTTLTGLNMSKMNKSAMPYLFVIKHNTAHHFMKYIFNKTTKCKLVIPITGQNNAII